MKIIIVLISLFLIVAGLGCVAISELATPARIDTKAKVYAVERGADANDYRGYPNLAMSNQLLRDIESGHLKTVQDIQQAADRENLEYSIVTDTTKIDNQIAKQREQMLFGEKGLLSLGLSMVGFGTLTGLIGLMRKRPGDITQVEMEQALATVTGKTTEELSAKQRQFAQLVKGVQEFMDTYRKTPPIGEGSAEIVLKDMKAFFNATQDTDTQVAVAEVKKSS